MQELRVDISQEIPLLVWWPALFGDDEEYVKRCDRRQHTKPPILSDEMPLRPIMATRAFAKWGIDFAGPIKPPDTSL